MFIVMCLLIPLISAYFCFLRVEKNHFKRVRPVSYFLIGVFVLIYVFFFLFRWW